MFSFQLSSLATLFSELSDNQSKKQELFTIVEKIALRHSFPQELEDKLLYFYKTPSETAEIAQDYDIPALAFDFLPVQLRMDLVLFMFKLAISRVPFFQKRENTFYYQELLQMQPQSVSAQQVIVKKGTIPESVFFIVSGFVENLDTRRIFRVGSFFGEADILRGRKKRKECFRAVSECYLVSCNSE